MNAHDGVSPISSFRDIGSQMLLCQSINLLGQTPLEWNRSVLTRLCGIFRFHSYALCHDVCPLALNLMYMDAGVLLLAPPPPLTNDF